MNESWRTMSAADALAYLKEEAQNALRERRIAEGTCTRCGNRATGGFVLCGVCRRYHRNLKRRRARARRDAAGEKYGCDQTGR